jgi:enoyl-CoA hydratase/carnithine racemase
MPETRLGVPDPCFADQLVRFIVSDAAASEFVTARRAAALGLVNELGDPAEVESRAVENARAMAAIPSRGFAISKRMRTERLCATIRGGFPAQLEQFLDAWFGEEAQRLLRATADQIRRPSA